MKNLFKMVVICALFALIGSMTTSCTPDVQVGPPVFEVTGEEFEVTLGDGVNAPAISATLPVVAENIPRIYYLVREVNENEEQAKVRLQTIRYEGREISGNIKNFTLTSGEDGLRLNKKYEFYFIVAISDMSYLNENVNPIFSFTFETPEYYLGEEAGKPLDTMVLGTTYEGAVVDFRMPEAVKNRGHRVKWGVTNLAHYNMYKLTRGHLDVDFIHRNENMYPAALLKGDTVLDVCHENTYRMSEKYPGKIGYFEATYDDNKNPIVVEVEETHPNVQLGSASPISYYYMPAPGEPLIFLFSECGYTTCDLTDTESGNNADHKIETCDKGVEAHPTINFSWGPGWYWYPFRYTDYKDDSGNTDLGPLSATNFSMVGSRASINEEDYWIDGYYHKKLEVTAKQPSEFKGSVNIEVKDLYPDSGVLRFTPSKEVFAYTVGVFPLTNEYVGENYESITRDYLNGDPKLWQWFSTSEFGQYFGFAPYYNDSIDGNPVVTEIQLAEDYVLEAGARYYVFLTAVGSYTDDDGKRYPDLSSQSFTRKVFSIPNYTKDAPELQVTAYESTDPHKAVFNIKNISKDPSNKVKRVVYAANSTREFDAYMQSDDASYTTLVKANAGFAELTSAEIMEVNSDAGYDMEFPYLRDDQSFTLAVMGWNDESRPSNPDASGSKAVASVTTPRKPHAEALPGMETLNGLKGDWTATAKVREYDFDADLTKGEPQFVEKEMSWKVTIGGLETKSALTNDDYATFEDLKISKEDADKQFSEFKEQESIFNEVTTGQNRILCQGWGIDDSKDMMTTTPWDLLFSTEYGAAKMSYLFNDFGPKWFLQVNKDGDIFVPVNYEQVVPFNRWYRATNHYLVSGNFEHGYSNYIGKDRLSVEEVGIPVELSEDGNTITLKEVDITYTKVTTDEEGNETGREQVTCKGSPNVMFDYSTQPAFYNPYIASEVVLTRGWTEPAPDENPTLEPQMLRYGRQNNLVGKSIVNSADYKTPARVHSITSFSEKLKVGKVVRKSHKILSREEILNNIKEGNRENYWCAKPRK